MSDRRHELAEELWDLLAADVDAAQGHPSELAAWMAHARAVESVWDAIGAALASKYKTSARDRHMSPPTSPG